MNEMDDQAGIRKTGGAGAATLHINPGVKLQSVFDFPETPAMVLESMQGWTTWHDRTELSMRDVLSTPAKAAPFVAALLACGARVVLDDEQLDLEAFLKRAGRSRLAIEMILLPLPSTVGRGMAVVCGTPTDKPIVAAFASVEVQEGLVKTARLALTGTWKKAAKLAEAVDALVGSPLSEKAIAEVAAAVEKEVKPRGTYMGSESYRRKMAGVTARRALAACEKGAQRS